MESMREDEAICKDQRATMNRSEKIRISLKFALYSAPMVPPSRSAAGIAFGRYRLFVHRLRYFSSTPRTDSLLRGLRLAPAFSRRRVRYRRSASSPRSGSGPRWRSMYVNRRPIGTPDRQRRRRSIMPKGSMIRRMDATEVTVNRG
jgi:hypothetical protein